MRGYQRIEGMFIVIEGIDGSGKTTQAELLFGRLSRTYPDTGVALEREPSGCNTGWLIRQILQHKMRNPGPEAMALLFAADRVEHCQWIKEHLDRGRIVVCDRYELSTYTYQVATRKERDGEMPSQFRLWLHQINRHILVPDFTIVLDCNAQSGAKRRAHREQRAELFEVTDLQEKLCNAYRQASELVPQHPARLVYLVDGEQPAEVVHEEIWQCLLRSSAVWTKYNLQPPQA